MFFKKNLCWYWFFFQVGFSRQEGCAIFLIFFFFKKKDYFSSFPGFFEDLMKIEEREKRKKKKAVTKTKTGRGQKNFSNSFFLLNKIKECEYVEFCAPPRHFFLFLEVVFFFFISLEFANFARCRFDGDFFSGTAIKRHQSAEHTRSRNAQILISFLVYLLAAHPSVKTLIFRFVKEFKQRRSCTSFPRKA